MAKVDLGKEIAKHLKMYTKEVELGIKKVQEVEARSGAKTLRKTSPKDTGDYRKGWTVKKTKNGYTIHNRTRYQLTHLLEKGHAKVGGGRVKAYPHIGEVEDEVIRRYLLEVERVIGG